MDIFQAVVICSILFGFIIGVIGTYLIVRGLAIKKGIWETLKW